MKPQPVQATHQLQGNKEDLHLKALHLWEPHHSVLFYYGMGLKHMTEEKSVPCVILGTEPPTTPPSSPSPLLMIAQWKTTLTKKSIKTMIPTRAFLRVLTPYHRPANKSWCFVARTTRLCGHKQSKGSPACVMKSTAKRVSFHGDLWQRGVKT